jgi:enoyl-[acyl-carrier protein] reductase III
VSAVNASPRVIVITGGGRGIGRAIALRFAETGARIFVNFFVNGEAAEKTAREIELAGGTAHLVQADMKEPAQITRMFADIAREAGRVDVLVNNAASGVLKSALELSAKHWDWVMATNARPFLLCAQEAARLMGAGGRIIGLSSLGSHRVIPGYAAVGVSKAAAETVTRYLAVELAPRGITVNTVCAGAVDTDIWRMIPDGERLLEAARSRTPSGGLVTAEEVADVVYFLAGPAARSIQGQIVVADGGYSLLA